MFNSCETGPLANVLACEGKPGKVGGTAGTTGVGAVWSKYKNVE